LENKPWSSVRYKDHPDFEADSPKRRGVRLFFELYFSSFTKLVLISLLFTLMCLPVVTIPASVCGMTNVVLRISRDQYIFVWSDYWQAFKRCFKKSLLYGLIYAGVLALILLSYYVYLPMLDSSALAVVPLALLIAVSVLFIMMNFYSFLLIVTVKHIRLAKVIKYSVALIFRGMGRSLLCFALCVGLAFPIYWFFPMSLLLCAALWFSTACMVICFICWKPVQQNIIFAGDE